MIALWLVWLGLAGAAELEQVRVFLGQEHAQVLLVADAPLAPARVRTQGANVLAQLPDLALDDRLRQAYPTEGDRRVIAIDDGGVKRVLIWEQEGAVQVQVELEGPRVAHLVSVAESAVLLDLQVDGARRDPTLPDPSTLASWIAGVSLSRRAETVSGPRKLVVIDPGHGGHDSGAMSVTGLREADIALAISRRVARELERREGIDVVMTRTDDTFIPLRDRAALANGLDADLFISIHANAAPTWRAWGVETYYLDTASSAGAARVAARENTLLAESTDPADRLVTQLAVAGTNRLSQQLAVAVQTAVIQQLRGVFGAEQIKDQGVHTALFYVLVSTRMPAILFESGFVTDTDDEQRLRHPAYQRTIAVAIADAVEAFFAAQDGGR